MGNKFINNYASTLASAIGPSTTVLPLVAGGGAALTAAGIGSGTTVILTLIAASNPATFEIVLATAVSGDNVTVTRSQEGTTALSWNPADIVACQVTAGGLANFVSGAYVLSFNTRQGAVVGIATDYQSFYPQLSVNNTFTGTQTFNNGVTVGATDSFTTGNISDGGTGGGVTLKYAGGSNGLATTAAGVTVTGNLTVTGTGNFNTSSVEFKENIRGLVFDTSKFLSLEPIAYRHKKTREETVGVSAEQLYEICPELVQLKDGKPYAVNYQGLIPYLLGVVQDQQQRLNHLEELVLPIRH